MDDAGMIDRIATIIALRDENDLDCSDCAKKILHVMREPTLRMIHAACLLHDNGYAPVADIWRAMVDEANDG